MADSSSSIKAFLRFRMSGGAAGEVALLRGGAALVGIVPAVRVIGDLPSGAGASCFAAGKCRSGRNRSSKDGGSSHLANGVDGMPESGFAVNEKREPNGFIQIS